MSEPLDLAELERLARAALEAMATTIERDEYGVMTEAGRFNRHRQMKDTEQFRHTFTPPVALRLLAELRRCKEALAVYADESNWLELNSDQTTPSILPGWVGPGDQGRSVAAAALEPARE